MNSNDIFRLFYEILSYSIIFMYDLSILYDWKFVKGKRM